MDVAQHSILRARTGGMTSRRAIIIGGVGLLHAAAIYAIVTGMAGSVIGQIEHRIDLVPVPKVEPTPPPLPPVVTLVKPNPPPGAPIPTIVTASTDPPPIWTRPGPTVTTPTQIVPDTAAIGVRNTHSEPPYPAEARTLEHEGDVLLAIAVSTSGDVTSASVVTSSGHTELDQAAVNWVVAHWKYKPATRNGAAVASQTQAIVRFDLTQARR